MYYDKNRVDELGTIDVSGTNSQIFQPGQRVYVKRFIFVVTTALTSDGAVMTLAKRDADGGNSSDLMTFTIPDEAAADSVHFADVAKRQTGPTTSSIDSSIVHTGGAGDIEVVPGEELIVTSDGDPGAGNVTVYVEYVPGGFQEALGTEMAITLA